MWSRSELKDRAKVSIKKNIWMCIGISFIVSVLCGSIAGTSSFNFDISSSTPALSYEIVNIPVFVIALSSAVILLLSIFGTIYGIFIGQPLTVGHYRFYLENREECSHFNALLYAFKNGYYLNIVKTCFLMNLYIFLWTLLLIIPGIYKSFEYAMIPYLLAENPTLPTSRIFELSREMTYHQKFDMFILDMSFIGWMILALIPCGLGMLLLTPYMQATTAELYITMRDEQLDRGFASYDEFPGFAEEM